MTIWVSGSLAYDVILDYSGKFADHISLGKVHVLSLSFLVNNIKKSVGGTAGNISYNLVMLGIKPEILAAVGRDGKSIVSKLTQLRIKRNYLKFSKQSTAAAYIMTDRADNQITGFHAGAMNETVKLPKVNSKDWAIIGAENPENMARLARHYQKRNIKYIFDPGQAITALSKSQMQICVKGASIVIGNDYEMNYVFKYVIPRSVVIRTLGPKGSEIILPGGKAAKKIKIGIARAKNAVDPTGAGDAYRAGLIAGIVRGLDLKTSAQLGATTASFAVEKYGTQNHRFDYGILVKRYNKNFSSKL